MRADNSLMQKHKHQLVKNTKQAYDLYSKTLNVKLEYEQLIAKLHEDKYAKQIIEKVLAQKHEKMVQQPEAHLGLDDRASRKVD